MNDVRVLYLGSRPIGAKDATGQTLENIYRDLPQDSILQVVEDAAGAVGPNIVQLPGSAAPVAGIAQWSLRRLRASRVRAPEIAHDGMNAAVQRAVEGPADRLRRDAKAFSDLAPVMLPAKVVRTIAEFKPSVIHSLLGSGKMMRLALALSRRFDLPIVPHFMDDWMDSLYPNGECGGLAQKQSRKLLRRVLERSPVCLTIGSAMASDYRSRKGIECLAVGNSVEVNDYSFEPGRQRIGPTEQRELVYVGGLHLGRAEVLIQLAQALRDANLDDWKLVVHTRDADAKRFLTQHLQNNLRWRGEIDPRDVPRKLVDADALLFVESEDPGISRFTRFSVSTKVPQYLAANRPLIVVGPAGQASVEELRTHGAQVRVASQTQDGSLGQVVEGLSDWIGVGQGLNTPRQLPEQYDGKFVRQRFADALGSAVKMHSKTPKPISGML